MKGVINLENAVIILLIILGILFCVGVVSGIVSFIFVQKEKHPVLAILLAILCWFFVCVPVNIVISSFLCSVFMVLMGIVCGALVMKSVIYIRKSK